MELRYIRDAQKREVDFVVLQNRRAIFAVECKLGERTPAPSLSYFSRVLSIPQFFQVHLSASGRDLSSDVVRVLPFNRLVSELGLP